MADKGGFRMVDVEKFLENRHLRHPNRMHYHQLQGHRKNIIKLDSQFLVLWVSSQQIYAAKYFFLERNEF